MNIAILGAGSWGKALAGMWSEAGHEVRIWDIGDDMEEKVQGAQVIVNAIPSHAVREVMRKLASIYMGSSAIILNVCKGIEQGTLLRMSEVVREEIPSAEGCKKSVVVMSGPSHAEEVAEGLPTTNVIASNLPWLTEFLQGELANSRFRLYASEDVAGVELAGSLKNVLAICTGIAHGLGYGDNTKAAIMTRGIAEMTRLGVAAGANERTFAGLAGIGDVIVTCTSMHSRNNRAGMLIGAGATVEEACEEVKMVVEGVRTTDSAYHMAKKFDVDVPLIAEVYKVLFEGKDPRDSVEDLMGRQLGKE